MSRKKHHIKGGYSSSWIRPTTRLAIWLRDGLACVYCLQDWSCAGLTLDHVVPRSRGGGNDPTNVVSACGRCNGARRVLTDSEFAASLGISLGWLKERIRTQAVPLTLHLRRRAVAARKHPPPWLRELMQLNSTWEPQRELFTAAAPDLRPHVWLPDPTQADPNEPPPF